VPPPPSGSRSRRLFVLGTDHAAVALEGLTVDARVLIQYVPAA
jgi:hypothetical protein